MKHFSSFDVPSTKILIEGVVLRGMEEWGYDVGWDVLRLCGEFEVVTSRL
jgi:hypothetical protein